MTSQILTIRRILEDVHEKKLKATLLFVNFSKAFESLQRGKMNQILLTYGLPKETFAAIMMLYKNTKVKVHSREGNTNFFDIFTEDPLTPHLFIICQDYVLRMSIDLLKENGFT